MQRIDDHNWSLSNEIIESYQSYPGDAAQQFKFRAVMPSYLTRKYSITKKSRLANIPESAEGSKLKEIAQTSLPVLGRCVAIRESDNSEPSTNRTWLNFQADDIILVHCWSGDADLWYGSLATSSGLLRTSTARCGWFKQDCVMALNNQVPVPYRIHLSLFYEFAKEQGERIKSLKASFTLVKAALRNAQWLSTSSYHKVFGGLEQLISIIDDIVLYCQNMAHYFGQPCQWALLDQKENFIIVLTQFFNALKPAVDQCFKYYLSQLPFAVNNAKLLCKQTPQFSQALAKTLRHASSPVVALKGLLYRPINLVQQLYDFLKTFYTDQRYYIAHGHPALEKLHQTVQTWSYLLQETQLQAEAIDNTQLALDLQTRVVNWPSQPIYQLGVVRMSSSVTVATPNRKTDRRTAKVYSLRVFDFRRAWKSRQSLSEHVSLREIPLAAYLIGSTLLLFKYESCSENGALTLVCRLPPPNSPEPLQVYRSTSQDSKFQVAWLDQKNQKKILWLNCGSPALCASWVTALERCSEFQTLSRNSTFPRLSYHAFLPCPKFSLPICQSADAASPTNANSLFAFENTESFSLSFEATPSKDPLETQIDKKVSHLLGFNSFLNNRFSMGDPFDVNLPSISSCNMQQVFEQSILNSSDVVLGSVRKRSMM